MCLAIPGKILETIDDDSIMRQGKIAFSGIVKQVSLMLVPDAQIGDYVLVHAGVAISTLNQEQAQSSLQAIEGMTRMAREHDATSRGAL
jgi:hydrogenase expression/formation protein HypC